MKIKPRDILYINHYLATLQNAPRGVADESMLKAALLRPSSTFSGESLYPDPCSRAGALAEFLIKGRPFLSCHHSTAIACGLYLLHQEGLRFSLTDQDLDALGPLLYEEDLLTALSAWFSSLAYN